MRERLFVWLLVLYSVDCSIVGATGWLKCEICDGFRKAGALVFRWLNHLDTPLARQCRFVVCGLKHGSLSPFLICDEYQMCRRTGLTCSRDDRIEYLKIAAV